MTYTKEELVAEAIKLAKKVDEYNKSCDKVIGAGGVNHWISAIRIERGLDMKTFGSATQVDLIINNDEPIRTEETLEYSEYYRYAKREEDGITIVRNVGRR